MSNQYPPPFESREAWVAAWIGKHSTAYHGGDPEDCDQCREMIALFGPMPPGEEIEAAERAMFRERNAERYQKRPIPAALRIAVFGRDAYRCQVCGDWHDLRVDHIFPESKGGTLDMANLQTLCQSCNSRKGTRT